MLHSALATVKECVTTTLTGIPTSADVTLDLQDPEQALGIPILEDVTTDLLPATTTKRAPTTTTDTRKEALEAAVRDITAATMAAPLQAHALPPVKAVPPRRLPILH